MSKHTRTPWSSSWRQQKIRRREFFEKYVYGWKMRDCTACAGSGHYDHDGSPKCGSCGGTGKETYNPDCDYPERPLVFMNEIEIDQAVEIHRNHPVLSKATRLLSAFRHEINHNSDGWAYWKAPVRSVRQLIEMINYPVRATEDNYKKAVSSIKAFCTRNNRTMPPTD